MKLNGEKTSNKAGWRAPWFLIMDSESHLLWARTKFLMVLFMEVRSRASLPAIFSKICTFACIPDLLSNKVHVIITLLLREFLKPWNGTYIFESEPQLNMSHWFLSIVASSGTANMRLYPKINLIFLRIYFNIYTTLFTISEHKYLKAELRSISRQK